jgi:hypothetical protein
MERVKPQSKITAGATKKLTVDDLKKVIGGTVNPNDVLIETKEKTKIIIK